MTERWGVYSYTDSTYYKSDPPTKEGAQRNLELLERLGESCEVVTDHVGWLMEQAVAHSRFNDWVKRNNL